MQTMIPPVHNSSPPVRSGLALASLILGIASLVLILFGPVLGIAAAICGHRARTEIRNSGGKISGRRMALAGIICGYLATFAVLFGLVAVFFLSPRIMAHQRVSSQRQCQENLEMIQGYKEKWALERNHPPNSVPRDNDLFGPGKYLEAKPICPGHGIYILNAVQDPPYCTLHGAIRW